MSTVISDQLNSLTMQIYISFFAAFYKAFLPENHKMLKKHHRYFIYINLFTNHAKIHETMYV